jgi:hypothetical protein
MTHLRLRFASAMPWLSGPPRDYGTIVYAVALKAACTALST